MDTLDAPEMVDLVFAVHGTQLPADYRHALYVALDGVLPWLADAPRAGIHGIRTVPTERGIVLLAQRARLTLRLPRDRLEAASALEGARLDVAGNPLDVGACHVRALAAADTLHAEFVATGSRDEAAFIRDLEVQLARLDARCRLICGRPRQLRTGDQDIEGFAVALHGLNAQRSLRLQQEGLGAGRMLGCGLFVQHKSIVGPL